MKLKFKKLNKFAKDPEKAHDSDAAFDLVATSVLYPHSIETGLYVEIGTGISFEIPEGYAGFVFPRSSISATRHSLRNCVGVIDSGYRGEVKMRFSVDDGPTAYMMGNKVGQILFLRLPKIDLVESKDLSESERAEGGFGSTGE